MTYRKNGSCWFNLVMWRDCQVLKILNIQSENSLRFQKLRKPRPEEDDNKEMEFFFISENENNETKYVWYKRPMRHELKLRKTVHDRRLFSKYIYCTTSWKWTLTCCIQMQNPIFKSMPSYHWYSICSHSKYFLLRLSFVPEAFGFVPLWFLHK